MITNINYSAIKFITPEQRHKGQDNAIFEARDEVYRKAKERHPNRWCGETRNWKPATEVYLNPDKPKSVENKKQMA